MNVRQRGEALVLLAFVTFGLAPIYWKTLHDIPAELVLAHRTFWSLLVLGLLLCRKGEFRRAFQLFKTLETLKPLVLSAFMIGINWLTYLHALKENRLAEASLGYFLSPLLTIALGAFLYGERLTVAQAGGVMLLTSGVLYRTAAFGTIPLYALVLAVSFSIYSIARKRSKVGSEEGMFAEMLLLLPFSATYAFQTLPQDISLFTGSSVQVSALLYASGIVTALPMVWYISGSKHVSMQFLGVYNYLSPTLYLLLAVGIYSEPFRTADAVSFVLIWSGIGVFLCENLFLRQRPGRPQSDLHEQLAAGPISR